MGENDAFDCFGLVVDGILRTLNQRKEHYPEYIRYPSDVIKFFGATKSAPRLGDLVFKMNSDGETYHTLVYRGEGFFQHSTARPDKNGDSVGVITEFLPQLVNDQNYVLSLERYTEYVARHYEGTNVNWIE